MRVVLLNLDVGERFVDISGAYVVLCLSGGHVT